MTIDIHALLEKNLITKKMLQPKFGYKYLGPYNPLDKQMLYNKQTGDIYKYYDKSKNILDKIASKHDTCYSVGKNKNDCDRIMVKEIDNMLYKDRPFGTFAIKQVINTKQKLGMGNFTMEDLSNDLNKGDINKFERKKVIVNHIDEIHSYDLVDMSKYSRINKGYKELMTMFKEILKASRNNQASIFAFTFKFKILIDTHHPSRYGLFAKRIYVQKLTFIQRADDDVQRNIESFS